MFFRWFAKIGSATEMSARAMHEFTDLLPLVEMAHLHHPPEPVGTSTVSAMEAGLYWLVVGAIRELTDQVSKSLTRRPEIFITGGAGPAVAELLGRDAHHVPHLTLGGIALATPLDTKSDTPAQTP